jgi:HD-GYP domain-containing protein (c-di-GMP phosphodiesterase class II)
VADVCDAIVSNRPCKSAFSNPKALRIMMADSCSHFDSQVIDAFVKNIDNV